MCAIENGGLRVRELGNGFPVGGWFIGCVRSLRLSRRVVAISHSPLKHLELFLQLLGSQVGVVVFWKAWDLSPSACRRTCY